MKKLGIWFLAVCLFTAQILFRTALSADEPTSWKHTYTQQGECKILFPTMPELIQQSIQVSEQGHRLNYDIYISPYENKGVFLLMIATYPMTLNKHQERAGLDGLLRGIVGHHEENQLIYSKENTFLGHSSFDFLVKSSSNYFRGQAFMVGNKLFLIAMEGQEGTMSEKVFQYFLKSFQLLSEQS